MRHTTTGARANAYYQIGEYDKAIADYNEVIREAILLDYGNGFTYHSRADAYFQKGDYDKAMADYDEALRLDSQHATGYQSRRHVYRGHVYDGIGDYDRAI